MKLIEKIVDKFLNDCDYAFGVMIFSFFTLLLLSGLSVTAYTTKLNTDIKLAKIAAGQNVDDKIR